MRHLIVGSLILGLAAGCTAAPAPVPDDGSMALGAAAMDSMLSAGVPDSVAAPPVRLAPDTNDAGSATLAEIGYENGVTLNGAIDAAVLSVPVNPGQRAARLVLDVLPTPRMPEGTVILRQGERILAQRLVSDTSTTVTLPLDGAIIDAGRAIVSLGVSVPGRDACAAPLFYRTVFPAAGRVEYTGQPSATTAINGFFPPRLRRVVFHLPEQPSLDAAQAALDAAAFVARTYRGTGTTFEIGRLPDSAAAIPEPGWDERAIVWATDGPSRILRPEGGRGTVLAVASRRDARQLFTVAEGPRMVPTDGFASTTVRIDDRVVGTTTLDDLGFGSVTAEGSAITATSYRFALADFGPASTPRAFRLVARHSTPPAEASGEVAVLLNGALIWSRPLEGTLLDAVINLPPHLLGRENRLEVRFMMRLSEGECRLGAPLFTVTVDGESAFLTEADLPMAPSFDRFPAAMLPTFSVWLEPRDRFRVELASTMVAAMQRTTVTPLAPFLVRDPSELRGAVLAVGTAGTATALDAPVSSEGFRLRDTDGRVWDEYQPTSAYAAMQAFEARGRNVLLLHHTGADGLPLEALLRETLAPYGWFGLHGDLALRGPDGPATVLTAANAGWRIEAIRATESSTLERWRSAIFAGAAILLLGLLIWWYPRVVRRDLDPAG